MIEKNKKPSIRFKGFTDDWEQRKLENVTEIITKGTTPIDKNWIGPVNYIKTESIDKESGNLTRTSSTSFKEHEGFLKRSQMKTNDILFSIVGTLGRVGIVKSKDLPANTNQQIAIIRLKELNSYFLMNALKSPTIKSFIDSETTIGAQPSLSLWQINKMEIYTPSIPEQEKIGTFFVGLDNLITLHQCKYNKLINLKKAIIEKVFPKSGSSCPEIRFKEFTDDWKQYKVKDICSISTGKSNTQDKIDDGRYPFYVRSPIVEHSDKYLYEEEAVLTVGDGVGTGKVFHYVNGKYDLHQRVYRMFDFNGVHGKYFYYYFSNHFYNRVMSMTAKTSVDSVRLEMIADMEIKCPSMEEQNKVAKFFTEIDNLIRLHQQELEKLKNIKKACLDKMFL